MNWTTLPEVAPTARRLSRPGRVKRRLRWATATGMALPVMATEPPPRATTACTTATRRTSIVGAYAVRRAVSGKGAKLERIASRWSVMQECAGVRPICCCVGW